MRTKRLLGGGALLGLGLALAGPGVGVISRAGAAPATQQAAACPPALLAGPGPGGQIAGYGMSALAAGFRYEIDSPGLLPVGDAEQGNITELDVPFARQNLSEGFVAARSSAAYPGDTAAGLGSALGTFGAKGIPNDPVVANAAYPPSPDAPASSTYPPSGEPAQANAGAASATASASGGTSDASVSSASLAQGDSGTGGGPSHSSTLSHVGAGCVDASAASATSEIVLAGIVHIAGVSGVAAARSDGREATPYAALHVGQVTVGGLAAYIDQNGIHLAGQQPVGYGVVAAVQQRLDAALAGANMTVKLLAPNTAVKGGAAAVDSGGLDIVIQQNLPAVGVPGVPAITVPGEPPIPLGTPATPLRYEVVYGKATVSVNATTGSPLPGSGDTGAGTGVGTTTASSASGATATSAGPGSPGGPGGTILSVGPSPAGGGRAGSSELGASRPVGSSSPVPVGWVIMGILASLVLAGPLLGYARWQLLEGRI